MEQRAGVNAVLIKEEVDFLMKREFESASKYKTEDNEIGIPQPTRTSPQAKHRRKFLQTLQCHPCGRLFRWKKSLRRHLINKHTRTKTFECKICKEHLPSRYKLQRHLFDHGAAKAYVCRYSPCGRHFLTAWQLKEHSIIHKDPVVCNLCDKKFTHQRLLKFHMKVHNTDPSLVCTVCGRRLSCYKTLENHMVIHTGNKPHQCLNCGDKFFFLQSLKLHMKRAHTPFGKVTRIICSYCKKVFVKRVSLEQHVNRYHLKERPYKCHVCEKGFYSKNYLRRHIMIHSGNKPFNCNICEKSFYKNNIMKIHLVSVHSELKRFECELCSFRCGFKRNLGRHIITKHLKIRDYECGVCKRKFSLREGLKSHLPTHLPRTKTLKCSICGSLLSTKGCLRTHKLIHTNEFLCSICPKKFTSKRSCVDHEKSKHSDFRYVCTVVNCGKKFTDRSTFRRHQRYGHTEDKPFECQVCHAAFKENGKLNLHIACHYGQFRCPVCDKGYSRSNSLREHMESHDSKIHRCEYCNNTYNARRYLTRHILGHLHSKRLLCGVCGAKYSGTTMLRRHCRRKHSDPESFKCGHCNEIFTDIPKLLSHLRSSAEELQVMCHLCGQIRFSKSELRRHIMTHVTPCCVCGKSFLLPGSLTHHLSSHASDNAFNCSVVLGRVKNVPT